MENGNSDEAKNPSKQTLVDTYKSKRWTFKVKNNFSKYLTVEPLICFYMLQILVVSLSEPHKFHKACTSLDQDTYFCDVITINHNSIYEKCAEYNSDYLDQFKWEVYCKVLSEGYIDCWKIFQEYNETKVRVKPEDYRFCKVIEKTVDKISTGADSLVGISVMIITVLVALIVSIWSDKHSKRKICLLLPIFGKVITNIIKILGAFRNFLYFEHVNTAAKFIEAVTGGMSLFLFGCFTYMNNETFRHKLLFRFGVISLILTVLRRIPNLSSTIIEYYADDDSYINLMSTNLILNIICLLYVKIILNEIGKKVIANSVDNRSESINREVECISNAKSTTAAKHSKLKRLAKTFSLDVIWDYILIIFKKRSLTGRRIIILFLVVILVDSILPHGLLKFTAILNENIFIDNIDVDAAIFVIISITMLLFKISDAFVSILVIIIPAAARLVLEKSVIDVYFPIRRIATCSFLLGYVDKNESRIFLIVQAIGNISYSVFQILSGQDDVEFDEFLRKHVVLRTIMGVMIPLLPLLEFCGLGLLYKFTQYYDKNKAELKSPTKTKEIITESPHNCDEPAENDNNQQDISASVSKDNEVCTHF